MEQNLSPETNISSQGIVPFFESFTPPKISALQMNQTTQIHSSNIRLSFQESTESNPSVITQKHGKNKRKREKKKRNDEKSDRAKKSDTFTKAGKEEPLKFWDCAGGIKEAPSVEKITKLHIYDFDNTLFHSPSPNPDLFNDQTLGILTNSDMLSYGGWWSEPLIFRNMGEGWDIESNRQWKSFWNQDVEDLLKLSYEQEDALAIVLTGRKSYLFADFIKEI